MKTVFGSWRLACGLIVVLALGQAASGTRSWAADPAPATSPNPPASSSSGSPTQVSVKIEPYTGPPVYLQEAEQIAKPTIVTHETKKENYEDEKTLRVERDIALYSDNNFAADGKYREFHPNGKPFIEGQFANGRQTGEWTYYFENGQVNRKATFNDGKPNGSWEVHRADGTRAAKRGFKDGVRDGEWITYDATGKQALTEEHYVSSEADGVWKSWYPNGKPKQQAEFKLGKRTGTGTEWNDKGQKLLEAEYADNKLNGTVTRYFADGKSIVQTYKDGKFVSESKR